MTARAILTLQQAEQVGRGLRLQTPWLTSYITKGGTYVIASRGKTNDDGKPRDLVTVTRDGRALAMTPLVNPQLVAEVQAALDVSRQR